MQKIDRTHKNYLTPEIWEEKHLREIFYGTFIFQQSSMICIVLYLKFKCKICVQKAVIRNFQNHILVTCPATDLLILRQWCRFEKPNHFYFV